MRNTTIYTLDFIAVVHYNIDELDGFFNAPEDIQALVMRDYTENPTKWRKEAGLE